MKTIILNQQTGKMNNEHQSITLPEVKSQKPGMKKRFLIATAILGLLMSGCLVKSLHPFYSESDIVFRKDIIGSFIDQDKGTWTIEQNQKKGSFDINPKLENNYLLKLVDKENRKATFMGVLFKLDNDFYVDFYLENGNDEKAETELYALHVVGVHTVARLKIGKNNLHIMWYNEKWLSELFEHNKIRLAHEKLEGSDNIVLTASTYELQKFMKKFANDPNAFEKNEKDNIEYILTRK